MHFSPICLAAATLISSTVAQTTIPSSPKRGLVFVPSKDHTEDNALWIREGSDLTWYYNYATTPSDYYKNSPQSKFEFVPMLWGMPTTSFADEVKGLIKNGRNITHVMAFNEPDGVGNGGSNISPEVAATTWIKNIQPLHDLGIKLGAPGVTGSPGGFTWLADFFDACTAQGTNCTADFFPVHWYGNFEGLASHLGQVHGTYPNQTIWVTEFALNDASLADTQSFFKTALEYLDRIPYIERYSYFGSFRSDVSNVGPNAALLTEKGQLTDLGSWYLGGSSTGSIPHSGGPGRYIISGTLLVGAVGIALLMA